MLQLGLGLGLGKGAFISNLSRLKSKSTMLLDTNKADGLVAGINSPATNPMVDLASTNDLSLQNYAFTAGSGYEEIIAPNGKTVTALKCDGVDDYGILPNSADLDPTGLDDFGMAFVIKTTNVNQFYYIYYSDDGNNIFTPDLALQVINTGEIRVWLSSVAQTTINQLSSNTFYKIIMYRKNEFLKLKVNNVLELDLPMTSFGGGNIQSKTIYNMFARINNAEGTEFSDFFNGYFLTGDFTLDPSDSWESAFNKYAQQAYGL